MELKKINDIRVKPIPGMGNKEKQKVLGSDIFPNCYGNVCIVAPTNSGKTTCVYNILEKCAYNTDVLIFAPTINNDESFKKMEKMLIKKKCRVKVFDHFLDGKANIIDDLINMLRNENEVISKPEDKQLEIDILEYMPNYVPAIKEVEIVKEKKIEDKKKEKEHLYKGELSPEYILYFDDLSSMMRHGAIHRLLTYSRQFKMRVIINIHAATDLLPSSYANINYLILFGKQNKEKIEEICQKAGVEFDDNKLLEMYEMATKEPKSFLYINTKTLEFRKNFNHRIEI